MYVDAPATSPQSSVGSLPDAVAPVAIVAIVTGRCFVALQFIFTGEEQDGSEAYETVIRGSDGCAAEAGKQDGLQTRHLQRRSIRGVRPVGRRIWNGEPRSVLVAVDCPPASLLVEQAGARLPLILANLVVTLRQPRLEVSSIALTPDPGMDSLKQLHPPVGRPPHCRVDMLPCEMWVAIT